VAAGLPCHKSGNLKCETCSDSFKNFYEKKKNN
jgi:hypothetical protein